MYSLSQLASTFITAATTYPILPYCGWLWIADDSMALHLCFRAPSAHCERPARSCRPGGRVSGSAPPAPDSGQLSLPTEIAEICRGCSGEFC